MGRKIGSPSSHALAPVEKGTTLTCSEVTIVDETALKKLVFDAVFQLLPQGPISLKRVCEILQQRIGLNLAAWRTLIQLSAKQAADEWTQGCCLKPISKESLLDKLRELPATFKGVWEPLPCNVTGRDRGRSLFLCLSDFPASGLDMLSSMGSIAPREDNMNRMQEDCNASAHTLVCCGKFWSPMPWLLAMWYMNVWYVGPVANMKHVWRVLSEETGGRGLINGTFINPKLCLQPQPFSDFVKAMRVCIKEAFQDKMLSAKLTENHATVIPENWKYILSWIGPLSENCSGGMLCSFLPLAISNNQEAGDVDCSKFFEVCFPSLFISLCACIPEVVTAIWACIMAPD